jgi:DnaJ-domain-containing protein 1
VFLDPERAVASQVYEQAERAAQAQGYRGEITLDVPLEHLEQFLRARLSRAPAVMHVALDEEALTIAAWDHAGATHLASWVAEDVSAALERLAIPVDTFRLIVTYPESEPKVPPEDEERLDEDSFEHSGRLVIPPPGPQDYSLLGVTERSSLKEVKSAYRKLARANHPDLHPGSDVHAERFSAAAQAYERISEKLNPTR